MTDVINEVTPPQEDTKNDASKLTQLINEIQTKSLELKNQLQPVIQKWRDGKIKTSKGVSFLEIKYQIMLQYIIQLGFFVQLKLAGKKVEGHPVIDSLVELRVILDKMKPIETKLKYQIDKLVRAAVMGSQPQADATEKVFGDDGVAADPLAFKPNIQNMVAATEEGGDDEDQEDGDTTDKTGVYRPPKLAPVAYSETPTKRSKREKDEQRMKERASRSRVISDLMMEMNDAPEETDALGGVRRTAEIGDSLDRRLAEKDKYEEDNYVRLSVTRKEKKRLKDRHKLRFDNEFENLNDFSNLVGIQEVEEEENQRFRDVLRRKQHRYERQGSDDESGGRGNKRSRRDDTGDTFHGLLDGEGQSSRNKFARMKNKIKRNQKGKR